MTRTQKAAKSIPGVIHPRRKVAVEVSEKTAAAVKRLAARRGMTVSALVRAKLRGVNHLNR